MALFLRLVFIIPALQSFAETQLNTLISSIAPESDKYTFYFIDLQTTTSSDDAIEINQPLVCKYIILDTTVGKTSLSMPNSRSTPSYFIFIIPYGSVAFNNASLPENLAKQRETNSYRIHYTFEEFWLHPTTAIIYINFNPTSMLRCTDNESHGLHKSLHWIPALKLIIQTIPSIKNLIAFSVCAFENTGIRRLEFRQFKQKFQDLHKLHRRLLWNSLGKKTLAFYDGRYDYFISNKMKLYNCTVLIKHLNPVCNHEVMMLVNLANVHNESFILKKKCLTIEKAHKN